MLSTTQLEVATWPLTAGAMTTADASGATDTLGEAELELGPDKALMFG